MPTFNPNPNMFRIMDYGSAVQAGQNIQTNRLKNEALGLDVQEAKNMLQRRDKAREVRAQIDGMPDQIQALEDAELFEEADKLRDTFIKTRKAEVELIQQMRGGIDESNYDAVRQGMIEEGVITPDLWPVEYSDTWFRDQVNQKRGNLTKLTRRWAEDGVIMAQDIVQQDGSITWEGEAYEDPGAKGKGAGAGFKFTASDNNSIGSEAANLFGGFYDPQTGQLTGLSADMAQRVTSLREEATRIYQQAGMGGQPITHSMAVARAARKMNIAIPKQEEKANIDDVLGLGQRPGQE